MEKIFSRLGDGWFIQITEAELMKDIEDGTQDASERASIAPLSDEEIKHLFEMCKSACKISGIEKGHEVIMTYDGGTNKIGRLGINTGRLQVLQIYENRLIEKGELTYHKTAAEERKLWGDDFIRRLENGEVDFDKIMEAYFRKKMQGNKSK